MGIDLTEAQSRAVASGEAIRLRAPESGLELVLIRAEDYERLLEAAADRASQRAWLNMASETRRRWVRENPY